MPYSPKAIANYFLERGWRESIEIDPLKLQKLVYYAHGWHLAVHGSALIDEKVDAWPYGPVIPTVYHAFKHYGRFPIRDLATEVQGSRRVPPRVPPTDAETLELLEKVWQEFRNYSGLELSNMTHREGTPWYDVWEKNEKTIVRGTDIDDEKIRDYFVKLARQSQPS